MKLTDEAVEAEFQRWWRSSKYCQVILPQPHLEQYARDGFEAGLSAALASDAHNHREPGEFGEGATVRRGAECATQGCEALASVYFERHGVGSNYCHDCYMKVQAALEAKP